MSTKGKFIGINQRIPFVVLDSAIHGYLESGEVDRNLILEQMLEFTTGVNRANKATSYVVQILSRQQRILIELKASLTNTPYNSLRLDDRKALCLCLTSLTYPITYNLLIALSQGFKVQSQINKSFIGEKVMSIYGSNRTVDIAIDALIPMLIELNTIKRDKISIYSLSSKLAISNKFVFELIIFCDIKLSESKSTLLDNLSYRPWFAYFDIDRFPLSNFNYLLNLKDSSIGKGYITIKR